MKPFDSYDCAITDAECLAPGIYSLTAAAPPLAAVAQPGQFAQLLVPGKTLRRPISICEIGVEEGLLRFVFQVRGEGTAWLSGLKKGDTLSLLGPLGKGFALGDCSRRALFVGGGIGVPPLLQAARAFGKNAVLAAGFRSRENIILTRDFERAGCRVLLATDDGSFGHHGTVAELIDALQFDVIFACGPKPMLKAVAAIAREHGVPCQVSMEERMACGVGACLGCAIKLHGGAAGWHYGHVCSDGPVFDSESIVWEEEP